MGGVDALLPFLGKFCLRPNNDNRTVAVVDVPNFEGSGALDLYHYRYYHRAALGFFEQEFANLFSYHSFGVVPLQRIAFVVAGEDAPYFLARFVNQVLPLAHINKSA